MKNSLSCGYAIVLNHIETRAAPVSYTHLDVYKRQALNRQLAQLLIRLKCKGIYTRNLSDPISESARIHIMLHRIRRYNDIANVDLRSQGTGDTCVHNRTDMEPIRQNLTAHTCIYLADTRACLLYTSSSL